MQVKDLEVTLLQTDSYKAGTILWTLRQAATEYPWSMYGVNSMAISDA